MGLWSPVDDVKVEKEEEERKKMDNYFKKSVSPRDATRKRAEDGDTLTPCDVTQAYVKVILTCKTGLRREK